MDPSLTTTTTTVRVRLPQQRGGHRNSSIIVPPSSYQLLNNSTPSSAAVVASITHIENAARLSQSRYTFPSNITPPSVIQSQRRSVATSNNHQNHQQQLMRATTIGDHHHPGLVTPVKPVYKLNCRHCQTTVCARGMKAILLADTTIELYSTDTPSQSIHVLDKDYLTRSCHCRIRDVACLECGNVIGYHVVSPCSQCLEACNNGHFWMFHSSACQPAERHDHNKQIMLWNNLPRAEMDLEFMMGTRIPYDQVCR